MYKMSLKHSAITESKEAAKSTNVTLEALKGQFEEAPAGQAWHSQNINNIPMDSNTSKMFKSMSLCFLKVSNWKMLKNQLIILKKK